MKGPSRDALALAQAIIDQVGISCDSEAEQEQLQFDIAGVVDDFAQGWEPGKFEGCKHFDVRNSKGAGCSCGALYNGERWYTP
jgi:hypothetical protein